ncbi:hypothetical protein A6046_03375 [[Haemophilus] ducreyi]|uniref:Uncharacterized protein n=2 Tax=Haemophilus ducreyi TaxID=730 RepID=Q7VPE9_HAEDU|nr:hypothetical protein [[Haemophilus] ducreyi]AAP95132.1 hypothetical protein HD_0136 [[Haemophilus] ducreyi 35000HP]AKO30305.1 hypothetical protein RY60_00525 [[Haemophilus] ducreyi]AKO31738.1 hypothetical protein RZ57_00530 [[Haemophilus] ducreyi]AKO33191.1 hypothetical protein RZ58_00530 [[Haemophilus] ducreyi]AKO34640.1 hypothetical protein RZ59_00525 [[Haemophilus] ducreyi]
MRNETYSYAQGKIFLAARLANGDIKDVRWVGDVSEASLSLSVEEFTHKESYSGQRQEVRKIITGKSGELSLKFHEMSRENLALLLLGADSKVEAGTVTGEKLPAEIKVGDRIVLAHQNVSNVTIAGLTENTDFMVDRTFGTIDFMKAQSGDKEVAYSYGAVENVAMLTDNPQDLFLRYEGVNLAEQDEWVLMELYKINFNPTDALALINNDNALAALTAKAKVLADTTKKGDDLLGRFGRVVKIKK